MHNRQHEGQMSLEASAIGSLPKGKGQTFRAPVHLPLLSMAKSPTETSSFPHRQKGGDRMKDDAAALVPQQTGAQISLRDLDRSKDVCGAGDGLNKKQQTALASDGLDDTYAKLVLVLLS